MSVKLGTTDLLTQGISVEHFYSPFLQLPGAKIRDIWKDYRETPRGGSFTLSYQIRAPPRSNDQSEKSEIGIVGPGLAIANGNDSYSLQVYLVFDSIERLI